MLVVAAFMCNTVFSLSASDLGRTMRAKQTYMGTEASTNPNNPCKGATTRECAIFESYLVPVSEDETIVIETLTDAEGNTISSSSYRVTQPIYVVKEGIISTALKSGATIDIEE